MGAVTTKTIDKLVNLADMRTQKVEADTKGAPWAKAGQCCSLSVGHGQSWAD